MEDDGVDVSLKSVCDDLCMLGDCCDNFLLEGLVTIDGNVVVRLVCFAFPVYLWCLHFELGHEVFPGKHFFFGGRGGGGGEGSLLGACGIIERDEIDGALLL